MRTNLGNTSVSEDRPEHREGLGHNDFVGQRFKLDSIIPWRERNIARGGRGGVQGFSSGLLCSLTCQESDEHWSLAQVPEHEEFSSGVRGGGHVAKQVDVTVPEPTLKAQDHLRNERNVKIQNKTSFLLLLLINMPCSRGRSRDC